MASPGAITGYVFLALAVAIFVISIIICAGRAFQRRRAAHKFTLFEDENSISVVEPQQVNHIESSDPDPPSKSKKNRLPLANQFSAAAALNDAATPSQKPTIFTHSIQSADNYIWPSKGGSAVPVDVEWGRVGSPSSTNNKKSAV